MFRMTVTDAVKVHDRFVAIYGPCQNKGEFIPGCLTDEYGNTYDAHMPFFEMATSDETRTNLGIIRIRGMNDAKFFIGKVLTCVPVEKQGE